MAAAVVMVSLVGCGGGQGSGGSPGGAGGGGGQGSGGEAGSGGGGGSSNGNTACACIAAYGSSSMDEMALKELRDNGLPTCFHVDNPSQLATEAGCLPTVVGHHAGNGKDIGVYYYCSDVCPDSGRVGITFAGIKDVEACCAIGGVPLLDPAWGGFEACVPPEISPNAGPTDGCKN